MSRLSNVITTRGQKRRARIRLALRSWSAYDRGHAKDYRLHRGVVLRVIPIFMALGVVEVDLRLKDVAGRGGGKPPFVSDRDAGDVFVRAHHAHVWEASTVHPGDKNVDDMALEVALEAHRPAILEPP